MKTGVIGARFTSEEIAEVDRVRRTFPRQFPDRSALVRYGVMAVIRGTIGDSIREEAAIVVKASESSVNAPAAAVQNGRGSVVPITATPEAKGELSEK
jgi:hypothetical protein